jgi:protein-disulfide isomerase
MNKRLWVVFAVLVIAAIGGLIFWQKATDTSVGVDYFVENNYATSKAITADTLVEAYKFDNPKATQEDATAFANNQIPDHTFGNKDAKVTVVMYEDFACSACYAADQSTFEPLISQYQKDVLFIYRNFSIGASTSAVSESGAEATFKLGGEDVFWKMKNKLFDNTNGRVCYEGSSASGCRTAMTGWATELGLDGTQFTDLLDNASTNGIRDKTTRDAQMGKRSGVTGTPTWFLQGEKIVPNDGTVEQKIKDALTAAGVKVKS